MNPLQKAIFDGWDVLKKLKTGEIARIDAAEGIRKIVAGMPPVLRQARDCTVPMFNGYAHLSQVGLCLMQDRDDEAHESMTRAGNFLLEASGAWCEAE